MQLRAADIDRIDAPRAALEQDFREPARRRADIECNRILRIEAEAIERGPELLGPARDIGRRLGGDLDHGCALDVESRLVTTAPPTRTNPRLIRSWARARDATRPSATSV